MTTARREILDSIRRNLSASRRFDLVQAEHPVDHAKSTSFEHEGPEPSRDQIVANFCENLELIGAKFVIVENTAEAAKAVKEVIDRLGAKRTAISNSSLVTETLEELDGEFTAEPTKEFLFDSDLGITSAQWAIAETGTLVLESEAEDHRLISLVPPVHICIVPMSVIRRTMAEILAATKPRLSRTMTFVTGASRTSDIELTLAIGVHGPGELNVIILSDR